MQFQFRANDDNRTTGIIDALTKQVLAETTLLAFKHVGHGFQRPLVGARNSATATTVVEQGIDGFLQHTFFVADDDFRGAKLDQPLQPVITVDNTTVKIVEIGCREATTVKRHQRAQFRRNDRNDFQDHPFRTGTRLDEGFDQFQTLDELFTLGFRIGFLKINAQGHKLFFKLDGFQHLTDRLGTDADAEAIVAIFIDGVLISIFGQQFVQFKRRQARFYDDVVFEIENPFQILERHIEQQADARR